MVIDVQVNDILMEMNCYDADGLMIDGEQC